MSAQIAKLEDQGRKALITVFDGVAQLAYDTPTTDSPPAEKNALKDAIRATHSGFDTHFKQYSYDVNYNRGADIGTCRKQYEQVMAEPIKTLTESFEAYGEAVKTYFSTVRRQPPFVDLAPVTVGQDVALS